MRTPDPALPAARCGEFDALLDAAGDIAARLDGEGRILRASTSLRELQGAPEVTLASLVAAPDRSALRQAIASAMLEPGKAMLAEARIQIGGREAWFELRLTASINDARESSVFAVGRDMTAQHATEERLRHMATHDSLTELPNRLLLADRIRMVIASARRSGQGFAVASIGLDGFKKVNDGLGLTVGDAVLRMAAARLRKTLRDSDTLARIGGDEFVAVLPGTCNAQQIRLISGRLLASLQPPFDVEGHTIYVGATIGVSVYPQHAEDEVRLVALADSAMSRAKLAGKGKYMIYSAREVPGAPAHDISLEAAMFQAVREGEFLLFYQPIVDASSRRIEGFETLMRWRHPALGMVPPVRFVPIAETNGLINMLGAWALKAACVQLLQFQEVAGRPLYISVNISPRQFRSDKFLDVLDEALALSGLPGAQLVLEITEGTLMVDPVHAEAILARMAARRARIAIDDFGTGYSSLAYLKRFPISVLKVDRAFVKDLLASAKDGAIVNAVLDLARHLGLSVVAEGVETGQQLEYLEQRGCQFVQGYLTGKPMPAHVAMAALKENLYAELLPAELRARID
ncbi:putative bifunctional diguanylate cyclase/phosphodiesterase [Pseudoduganella sp. GCM10020061]|uniref:putative bifunctional diguanylate cyclase/phosphodiesterase n=1 Tax=Pseudoduganella sp. GCM10020061 TaxID=3317345 RepID=UPI00363EE8FF